MVDVEFFQKPSTANDVLGLDHNEIAIPPYATTRNHPSRDHSSIGATHLSIASIPQSVPPTFRLLALREPSISSKEARSQRQKAMSRMTNLIHEIHSFGLSS
jgi:hypothetical protein